MFRQVSNYIVIVWRKYITPPLTNTINDIIIDFCCCCCPLCCCSANNELIVDYSQCAFNHLYKFTLDMTTSRAKLVNKYMKYT